MRILLADHQARVRFALRALLDQQPGLTVVGETGEAAETLSQVAAIQPDLILLDWDLRGSVLDLLSALHSVCPGLRVIALSARPEMRQAILTAGADAFISKTDSPERVLEAIRDANLIKPDSKDKHASH
jgi:DNA-binding NarL/FixJ family response regulator